MRHYFAMLVTGFWLVISLAWIPPATAMVTPTTDGLPLVPRNIRGQQVSVPDWSRITWSILPPILRDGQFIVTDPEILRGIGYNPSRRWVAGMRPESLIQLGDLAELTSLHQLSLNQIASGSGTVLDPLTLNSFGLIPWQTSASLVQAIPQLGSLTVGSVEPILDLVLGVLGEHMQFLSGISGFAGIPLGGILSDNCLKILAAAQQGLMNQLLQQYPQFTGLPIQEILQGSGEGLLNQGQQLLLQQLSQIPELQGLPLNEILQGNWQGLLNHGQHLLLNQLLEHFPMLADLELGTIAGSLASGNLQGLGGGIASMAIAQMVELFPALGNLPLGNLPLTQYALNSIPGLINAPLQAFAGWGQVLLDRIPGVPNLPFDQFLPDWLLTALPILAIADVPLGPTEANRLNTVSGGTRDDVFQPVPCVQASCPHLELAKMELSESMHGRQWITGPAQPVPGGKGLLATFNGGMEPTGIKAWPAKIPIKLVIESTDEQKGEGEVTWYLQFRKKTIWGETWATPHFIGPFPGGMVREKGVILTALSAPPLTDPPEPDPGPGDIGTDPGPEPSPCPGGQQNCPLQHPLPTHTAAGVYSPFGACRSRCRRRHMGVDVQSARVIANYPRGAGDPVLAAADGTVTFAGDSGDCAGIMIRLNHPQRGLATQYFHLHRLIAHSGSVRRGQQIAIEGNSPWSASCTGGGHLHYEIHQGGGPVNPQRFAHQPPLR